MYSVTSAAVRFRVRQALADLQELALSASDATLFRISGSLPKEADRVAVRDLVRRQGCLIDDVQEPDLRSAVTLAAALPDEDFGAFVTATAILLADALAGGERDSTLYWHWDAYRDHYRLADPLTRSVLMAGFAAAEACQLLRLDKGPGRADLVSRSEAEVIAALCDFARSLDPGAVARIAGALHGRDAEKHRLALDWVLRDPVCRLPERSRRHPAEVLTVVAGVPGAVGFAEATALLLADAIRNNDAFDEAATGWSGFALQYEDLPRGAREALYAGFRHLKERLPDWTPYPGWSDAQIERHGVVIPLTAA